MPKSVRIVHSKKYFTRDKLEVIAKGDTLVTIKQAESDYIFPSLEHIENFFELMIREANQIGTPVTIVKLIDPMNKAYAQGVLNIQYPNHGLVSWLLVAPDRIKIHQDKKTLEVVVSVDGLEVFRRQKGEFVDRQGFEDFDISGVHLDSLYRKIVHVLEQAKSSGKSVRVDLASGIWTGGSYSNLQVPLILTTMPALTHTQMRAQQVPILNSKRSTLLEELRVLDGELDEQEKKGIDPKRVSLLPLDLKRRTIVMKLRELDDQLKALRNKQSDNPEPAFKKRHSEGINNTR